jgi:hypothetical protein
MLRPITPESAFITDWRSRVENLLTHRLPTCPDTLKKWGCPLKSKIQDAGAMAKSDQVLQVRDQLIARFASTPQIPPACGTCFGMAQDVARFHESRRNY